jgi:hypothetical protein
MEPRTYRSGELGAVEIEAPSRRIYFGDPYYIGDEKWLTKT